MQYINENLYTKKWKEKHFPRLDDLSFKYDEKFPMKNSSRFFFLYYKKMKYKIGIKKKKKINKNQQQQHAVLNNKGLND